MNVDFFSPPLVAILRGLTLKETSQVGAVLFDAGFRLLEVPLNRPAALACIKELAAMKPHDALIGGGTILSQTDVDAVYDAGGRLMVSPNCNPAVIAHAIDRGMLCAPGIATPTEAFDALSAGAQVLKIFPAEIIGPSGLKSIKTVLPLHIRLWPVGGICVENIDVWVEAGASGFGIGGNLYRPGISLVELKQRATSFVTAWLCCENIKMGSKTGMQE